MKHEETQDSWTKGSRGTWTGSRNKDFHLLTVTFQYTDELVKEKTDTVVDNSKSAKNVPLQTVSVWQKCNKF